VFRACVTPSPAHLKKKHRWTRLSFTNQRRKGALFSCPRFR
jgi:hypothetical protein